MEKLDIGEDVKKEGKSEEEVAAKREELKKEETKVQAAPKKAELVFPPVTDVKQRRDCVKYGSFMSGSMRPRVFCFDTVAKKYRYFHTREESTDVSAKAMSLARCEYEIHSKQNPGSENWDDPTGKATHRLTMRFEERAKRPIFVYSDNLGELVDLKDYGVFCSKARSEEETKALAQKLDRLLATLWYSNAAAGWNHITSLFEKIADRSQQASQLVANLVDGTHLLTQQRNLLLVAWANTVSSKKAKFRRVATLRLATLLRALTRLQKPTEKVIVESTQKIVKAYREHRNAARRVFDEEIRQNAARPANGIPASAVFVVSNEIAPLATGQVAVPREHMGFARFEFPPKGFQEAQCQVKLDWERFKIILEAAAGKGKVFGEFLAGDVSSMVLDDAPDKKKPSDKKWLRINGRKIKKPESFGDELNEKREENAFIDPASKFLALSVDSYLSRKSLLELKFYSMRIQEISQVVKELGTDTLAFRLKIWSGNTFWTSTPFARGKMKKTGATAEFKQTYRVRVDPAVVDFVTVSLWGTAMESGKLPDVLQTLKKEVLLGFTKIPTSNITEQKKVVWVPLNSGVATENPYLAPDQPMVSLNFKMLSNIPGNYPEAPLSGKAYNVGELVTCKETVPINYPQTEPEFALLKRDDLSFDASRAGTQGTPLRYPMTDNEWEASGLERKVPAKGAGELFESLFVQNTKVPFMFVLPATEEEFAKRNLPGNYAALRTKYQAGEVVTEMDSVEVKRICVLKGVDQNEDCYMVPLEKADDPNAEIIQRKLGDVVPVSEEGVCMFDRKKYYPAQLQPKYTDHEWSLSVGFSDDEARGNFLANLKQLIRDYWYRQKTTHSGDSLTKEDISAPVAGELHVYITEGKSLGLELFKKRIATRPGARMGSGKLQVKIGFKSPKSLADLFTSVFVDETLVESLATTLTKEDISVESELSNNPSWRKPGQPAGEVRNMGRLVKLPKSNALLTLTVYTTYIENGSEQVYVFGTSEIQLSELLNEQNPTHYYWLLLQSDVEGNLPQLKVWTMFYPEDKIVPHLFPNDPVKSFAAQLLLAAQQDSEVVDSYKQHVHLGNYNPNYMRVEQDFMTGFVEGKGQSEEEKVISAMLLSKVDPKKAAFEAWEYRLINAYRYLRQQARANIFSNMSRYLWDSYILKLMMNVTKTRTLQQYGPAEASRVESVIGSQIQKSRGSLLKLDRMRFWREAGSWKYSDIVALCKLGLPKGLRQTIWSELFGLSGARNPEFEEMKEARYHYYAQKGLNQDSIVFRQMEHDILEITLTNISQPSDEILLHNERAGVLKIAKAYYAWCLEENAKSTQTHYGYFKGVLHLIQKVWQLFAEVETFWCIIGFAKTLPYLFQTQNVMTGGLSWSHKLLLLAISTVIEIKYPAIYKAILRHGLPIEYYISDKLFTMLATVFPTDTLLRFYDIIALEAASKEPIRAMWVLLTGCIMLITLNETYIKAARNADEIELLINNTGINRLNTQKFVEQIYQLSSELFSTYHPSWEKVLAVLIRKENSAVGMEQAWTNKALALDSKYQSVKDLNAKVYDLLSDIRALSAHEESKEGGTVADDSQWVNNFVRRFCTYYGEYASKEVPNTVCIYLYKCCGVDLTGEEVTITYGDKGNETATVTKIGMIDKMVEFAGDPAENLIKILVPGSNAGWCEVDLTEYETDMPITLDKPLIPVGEFGGEIQHKGQKPQPFISLVLLVVSKSEGHIDDTYKHMKQSMMYESKIIRPTKKEYLPKQTPDTIAITKENIRKQFEHAGLQSIYTPGMKTIGETGGAENDKAALRHLFALLQSEAASHYAAAMPEIVPEVEALTEKTFGIFSTHYEGKLPLKRVLVSLIAAAALPVDDKLGHYYDIYTSLAGAGGNSFLLEDIIELIQLLCELHLVYIPPEYIPHLAEQVMTDGGINRITNAYILSADANVAETLKDAHLKGGVDPIKAVKVTEKVQDAFSRYWELWGHKQVFAGDPNSFCGSLNTVLGGYKARPKSPGPYKLVICYKHRGNGYYKEFVYDEMEKLVLFSTTPNELGTLLLTNRNNLSFVGERVKMTKAEFVSRIKRIPLLTELMRLHISLQGSLIPKTRTDLLVYLMQGKHCAAVVKFTPQKGGAEIPKPTPEGATPMGGMEKPVYRFDAAENRYDISMEVLYREDLLAEVKGRILGAISAMINDIMQANPRAEIPDALNPEKYLNHSLQFFGSEGPLDDYVRLEKIGEGKITLGERESDPHKKIVGDKKVFAFHMHGDYSTEWVKCLELEKRGKEFLVKTVLFPSGMIRWAFFVCIYWKKGRITGGIETQVIQRHYLLLDKKED